MGDLNLKCPLCCDKTFSSKQLLAEHLSYVSGNIVCPVCKNKWSSIAHLIEHLVLDNCEPEPNNDNIQQSNHQLDQKPFLKLEHSEDDISNETENRIDMPVDETSKLYEEYIDKNHDNSNFQIQEPGFIKLIDESGESRYMILTHQAPSSNPEQVTKQNGDGTISLGSLSVLNTESDTLITQDNDPEDQEVYSCSTCDVSFASVIEHIQNYHNDQEVVLEEPMDEDHKYVTTTPMRMQTEELVTRRVITDMGDIVESTQLVEPESTVTDSVVTSSVNTIKEPVSVETTYVKGQPNRRYVRIEKFCDSIIKDISVDKDKQSGPYHKVVIKEMATQTGTVIKVFYCVTCLTYVTTLNDFKKKPCKTLKYSCPHCPVAYDNSKSLCAHMKVHKVKTLPESSEISSVFQCEICSTNFPTNKSLKLHKRMHDPVKERADGTKTVPENGEPEDDSSIGHYLCTVCNKRIPTEYTEIHQNSHLAGEKINCYICNKKFSSLEYLHMHMTVHVTDDKAPAANSEKSLPYPCSYCKRAFARPHEKVKHERIHTGEKPHACVICGKSFRVSYCLTLHMRTHTGARPYACPQCPKRFKALSVYNHHLLTHSEVRAYKCPFCPKAFKTLVQLAGHKNSHTKPFQCQHCNRPFASLYAVRIHTETHSRQNNLRFSCAKCGASYARAFALKDHMKQAHGDVADVTDDKDDEEIIAMEYPDPDAITKISDDQMEELVVMNSDELIIS